MALIAVPSALTLRSTGRWALRTMTATPGPGLDGRQQWVRREARVWVGDVQVRGAWSGEGWGAYLAFLDQLAGPANTFWMPVCNSRAAVASGEDVMFVALDGDVAFADATSNPLVVEDDNPSVTVSAPAGATILQVAGTAGGSLGPGDYFSVDDFLYRVASNAGTTGAGAVTFNPPLRQAVPSGTALQVLSPRIRVRLPDDAAAEDAHRYAQLGAPFTLAVVEAFER